MRKVRSKSKKKPRFSREEAKQLIDDLFNFYGNPLKIREQLYKQYFKKHKGLTEEEIFTLMTEACWEYGIINMGVIPKNDEVEEIIWKPERLGEIPMKELMEEEEE